MESLLWHVYESRLFKLLLSFTGRVPAGFRVGWGHWMTQKQAEACVGPGWGCLVATGFNRCLQNGWRIHQIKEKYGGLRFYADMDMDDIEKLSYQVCEECGKPGKPRTGGWIKTLCDECAKP